MITCATHQHTRDSSVARAKQFTNLELVKACVCQIVREISLLTLENKYMHLACSFLTAFDNQLQQDPTNNSFQSYSIESMSNSKSERNHARLTAVQTSQVQAPHMRLLPHHCRIQKDGILTANVEQIHKKSNAFLYEKVRYYGNCTNTEVCIWNANKLFL